MRSADHQLQRAGPGLRPRRLPERSDSFWEYEKDFHYSYLDACDTKKPLDEAYKEWKEQLLSEHLPGKSPNPEGDTTNWKKSFETGKREV